MVHIRDLSCVLKISLVHIEPFEMSIVCKLLLASFTGSLLPYPIFNHISRYHMLITNWYNTKENIHSEW